MITFKSGRQLSLNNIVKIKSREDVRILDNPEGFFKDMSDKDFLKLLDDMGINYKLKEGKENV
ncbi:hypothetical protein [Clostridium perfringens]|jgi:hypothetical protein|uniref:Uncharacterized protein n=1 Tax=Clostridium perfringens TaxID=1502 RepID=A0AAW4IZS4_CLOPF|nr:hypothetical protein [Clostridium perfringens]MBO3356159.1 hypothetical protein [Clostridium perfringens]MBO3359500.1 hypothetical protein [Clostridium perfringens]